MKNTILSFDNVSLFYQSPESETHALDNLSFSVGEGEFVSIVGPSGCGKTTILSLISGLLSPSNGKIFVAGKEVNGRSGLYATKRSII